MPTPEANAESSYCPREKGWHAVFSWLNKAAGIGVVTVRWVEADGSWSRLYPVLCGPDGIVPVGTPDPERPDEWQHAKSAAANAWWHGGFHDAEGRCTSMFVSKHYNL